jgi:hypothetical protein
MRSWLTHFIVLTGLLMPSTAPAADDPEFDEFTALIERTLAVTGPGAYPGDRSELYRFTESGWEIQMMTLWDGERWQLLALRLHHPQRIEQVEGQWQERYDNLLAGLDRNHLPDLDLPELIDVPAPDYSPALPDELRSRRFNYAGFWYEVRWFNSGGVDERAEWSLRSYELVALPHLRR